MGPALDWPPQRPTVNGLSAADLAGGVFATFRKTAATAGPYTGPVAHGAG